MVLILLGTLTAPFIRPLVEIEKAIKSGHITEPVTVQSGSTHYGSEHMTLVPFLPPVELEAMCAEASYVICQGGIGSIMMGLRNRKKVIATPRLKKYNEVPDDHQLEVLHVFAKNNYILPWTDEGLITVLNKLDLFTPAQYPFEEEKISDAIIDFLNKK